MGILTNPFDLEPTQAIAFLKKKGYRFSWDWTDTWEQEHARAFTVAKVGRLDILQDIRTAVESALENGTPFEAFKKDLAPLLQSKGWWGKVAVGDGAGAAQEVQLGSPWRLKTIYQTNMQSAYMAGRHDGMLETVANRPYWEYIATLDSRTRPAHAALHGLIFRYDDPFWDTHYPPNDWGCRCRVRNHSESEFKRDGLIVTDSTNRIQFEERTVGRDKRKVQVPGFRTDTGRVVYTGPGFGFNPARAAALPSDTASAGSLLPPFKSPKSYDKSLLNAYGKAAKGSGLANRVPVTEPFDIHDLVSEFAEEHPGHFARGFNEIQIAPLPPSTFMSTDCAGRISISSTPYATPDGDWVPARSVASALSKIRARKPLAFNEEYGLESLWHEILHNTAEGGSLKGSDLDGSVMEAANQFVARRTYQRFLKILGTTPKHKDQILVGGYGYRWETANFSALLDTLGISEKDGLKTVQRTLLAEPYETMHLGLSTALAALTEKPVLKIKTCLSVLKLREPANFKQAIDMVLKKH